ncbi:MAG TPA: nucleotide exchange factor GrpE [candidate division Zixibacteria bacterium]|nr:nucleotide exchange factor GrpE [candidate division Zixibacteria bacterium]
MNESSNKAKDPNGRNLDDLEPEEVPESEDTILDDEAAQENDGDERIAELEEKLAAAESQAAEYLDGWQRARAEYANARKRLERERSEASSRASVDYARKMLPVLDDFNRAMANVPEIVEQDDWFEGITLVSRKMESILSDLNVERIEAVGEPFDPNIHEALSLTEAEGFESGTVVEEVQSGYRIGDRVIRPVLVNVAA